MKFNSLKKVLVGSPLATAQARHERLSKTAALAVFSSDALSSVAYATEEILLILVLAGTVALHYSIPIGFAIAALIAVVVSSYRQTIFAYPQGGGSYIVTKDNLGTLPGLISGAALLIDYVLTVAVSVAAGVAALTSAVPALYDYRVIIGVGFVAAITVANLRGLRESGNLFALPTYLFISFVAILIVYGLVRWAFGWDPTSHVSDPSIAAVQDLSLFLVLRAFASGCAALTGVEAVSDGVPAFKPPEAKNARIVLAWLGVILISLFVGITFSPGTITSPRCPSRPSSPSSPGRSSGTACCTTPSRPRPCSSSSSPPIPPSRTSPPVLLPRAGRLPASPVRIAGRPPRLLERHPHPGRHRRRAPRHLRRQHPRPDPPLRGGSLPLLHPVAGEHGAPMAGAPRAGMAMALVAQRGGRSHHGTGGGHHHRHQVHSRGVGGCPPHPTTRDALHGHPPPLRRCGGPAFTRWVRRATPMQHTVLVLAGISTRE